MKLNCDVGDAYEIHDILGNTLALAGLVGCLINSSQRLAAYIRTSSLMHFAIHGNSRENLFFNSRAGLLVSLLRKATRHINNGGNYTI